MKEAENKKVLLHSCCAICSGHPIQLLKEQGYEPVVYFCNPNIYPESEYLKRLEAQRKLCESLDCELIVSEYMPELYSDIMKGFEDYPEGSKRCKRCFELRLLKTVQKAKDLGINSYSTSIAISPKKDLEVVNQVGKFFSHYFKIDFVDLDYRKKDGVLKTNKIANELDLYRQNYCGCEVSMQRLSGKVDNIETNG